MKLLKFTLSTPLIFVLFCLAFSTFANEVAIEIDAKDDKSWKVTWTLAEPQKNVSFLRSHQKSRLTRWKMLTPNLQLSFNDGVNKEQVTHVNGDAFREFTIELPRRYHYIEGEYAEFAPYAHGGTLFYTGRLFVCINECEEALETNITLLGKNNSKIISDSFTANSSFSWDARIPAGQFVYIGATFDNLESETFLDRSIESELKLEVEKYIDAAIEYFTRKFKKDISPQIFISWFDSSEDGRYGSQGGVIGRQLYYHWYGTNPSERKANEQFFTENLIWFIAHETAHLYQSSKFDADNLFIHEGMAEFMAWDFMNNESALSNYATLKLSYAQKTCQNNSFSQFEKNYACGLSFYSELAKLDADYPYAVWELYSTNKNQDLSEAFRASLTETVGEDDYNTLKRSFDWLP